MTDWPKYEAERMSPDEFRAYFVGDFPPPETEGVHTCGQPLEVVRRDVNGFPTLKCHRCDVTVYTEPRKAALAARNDRFEPWKR